MPGIEVPARMEEYADESKIDITPILKAHVKKQEKLMKYIATRDKPNLFWEGNSAPVVNNVCDVEVFKIPTGQRLLIGRLMILADNLTPGSGKYTNAAGYWQIFEGASRNMLAMPDFGPLDGTISGASQIPLVNSYGVKGLPFQNAFVRAFLNLPGLVPQNIAVMFLGWLEPEFPDTE